MLVCLIKNDDMDRDLAAIKPKEPWGTLLLLSGFILGSLIWPISLLPALRQRLEDRLKPHALKSKSPD